MYTDKQRLDWLSDRKCLAYTRGVVTNQWQFPIVQDGQIVGYKMHDSFRDMIDAAMRAAGVEPPCDTCFDTGVVVKADHSWIAGMPPTPCPACQREEPRP